MAPVDGLRAVAMTLVIAQHCWLDPSGWVGVWLFYVISGFVICRNLAPLRTGDPASAYRSFIARRFFRIVPLYVLYIAAGGVALAAMRRGDGVHDLAFLLTFTFNWQLIFGIWPAGTGWPISKHLWTLSVEEQFYLVFPLLVLFLPRRRFVAVAAAAVAAGPLIRWAFATLVLEPWGVGDPAAKAFAVYAASVTQFDAFMTGVLLAAFEPRLRAHARLRRAVVLTGALALAAYVGAYAWINASLGARGFDALRNILSDAIYGQGREVWAYTAVDLGCAAVMVVALTSPAAGRVLGARPLAYVGRVSYGGYVIHAAVLRLLITRAMPDDFERLAVAQRLPWFILAWLLAVALASLSYHGFERPIMRWSRSRRGRAASAPGYGLRQGAA